MDSFFSVTWIITVTIVIIRFAGYRTEIKRGLQEREKADKVKRMLLHKLEDLEKTISRLEELRHTVTEFPTRTKVIQKNVGRKR